MDNIGVGDRQVDELRPQKKWSWIITALFLLVGGGLFYMTFFASTYSFAWLKWVIAVFYAVCLAVFYNKLLESLSTVLTREGIRQRKGFRMARIGWAEATIHVSLPFFRVVGPTETVDIHIPFYRGDELTGFLNGIVSEHDNLR